jgi:hypothetical protein
MNRTIMGQQALGFECFAAGLLILVIDLALGEALIENLARFRDAHP